ncbi:MAG: 6-carboxytetrahydropterin synthase QueD, partial [Candidatus Omnitrophica bacterium]|nr:6-carboxytetrahydropterin synthase QueD [Candidatus Omnitrophota bacterium]
MFELEVELFFSAAHYLREYRGKCEALHGHNWKVKAMLAKNKLDRAGMVADFSKIKTTLREILGLLDHKNLNEISHFKKANPTSENIARFIFDSLMCSLKTSSDKNLKGADLKKVTVWETDTSSASYSAQKR